MSKKNKQALIFRQNFNEIKKFAQPFNDDLVLEIDTEVNQLQYLWLNCWESQYLKETNRFEARVYLQRMSNITGPDLSNIWSIPSYPYWRLDSR